ncbi:serine/threonine-protein kinase [Streptomyces johnsoniae]|uniref:non-specific serine/threonine protein kinase n=1 Tax=Streptomyces johnsoniae TaxID=3075532 RepID=A0ABU2SE19_9ACTN|nr:serine/threonine-protein kinase [Streptomyces sp. DSM 41886]MDT0445950.1 serine/threonine-protein kinase [Streptomyces sp. DSM 41886]
MDIGDMVGGRYALEERFDEGGQGEVWRAADERLRRTVVLKRILLEGERGRRYAQREAKILADMQHPNVVVLHDVHEAEDGGTDPGKGTECWLVMEYVESRSLSSVLRGLPDRRLPDTDADGVPAWRRAAGIGVQIARALQAVHAKGVVHRDVKPGNVLVTADWHAKLGDFGTSGGGDGEDTFGDTGRCPYTAAYAAPEVHRGGRATAASDVFSLGAALFAALEGRSVYGRDGEDGVDPETRARAGVPLGPRRAGPLTEVLDSLLKPLPEDRPDAAEARRLLERALAGRSGAARRRRSRTAALAAAALAAAGWLGGDVLVDGEASGDASGDGGARENGGGAPHIEDQRTADPCGLLSPRALARFGAVRLDRDYGNFDRCDLLVEPAAGGEVDVLVDLNTAPSPESAERIERDGEVGVVRFAADESACERFLLLPDGNWALVAAKHSYETDPDLCGMADAATDHALGVLNSGDPFPRRPVPFPDVSLALHDACGLPTTEALVAALPGVRAAEADVGFGDWSCGWHSSMDDSWIDLRFDRDGPLTAEDGEPVRFGRYSGALEPDGDGPKTCVGHLEYRTYYDSDNAPAVEKLLLVVSGPGEPGVLCETAGELMESMAAELPPAV